MNLDWYLKDVGTDILSPAMKNARKFILDNGGIERAQMMTKYKLAVFGQYEWQMLNYIPLFLFQKSSFPLFSYAYLKGTSLPIQIMLPSGYILT
jgi:hypothetical protein